MNTETNIPKNKLTPYLPARGAWALALGTSIGWGSMVVTSSSYLSQAGPWAASSACSQEH